MTEDEPVCGECGQVEMDSFSPEELGDLRELLDQISEVALNDNAIATLIEYKGEELVITAPENVKNIISEGLEEADVKVESEE